MMNKRTISLLPALTAVALAMAARGAFAAVGFTAPQLPESPYDDTEIATNFVISAQFDNARAFGVSLDFDATATNTLELAFGVDDDSNGELAWNETDFILGWRCGEWFCRDMALDAGHSVAASTGQKQFCWTLGLNSDMTPLSLSVRDGSVSIPFPVSAGMFSPEWNVCRVTARGMGGQLYVAKGSLIAPGFTLRFK